MTLDSHALQSLIEPLNTDGLNEPFNEQRYIEAHIKTQPPFTNLTVACWRITRQDNRMKEETSLGMPVTLSVTPSEPASLQPFKPRWHGTVTHDELATITNNLGAQLTGSARKKQQFVDVQLGSETDADIYNEIQKRPGVTPMGFKRTKALRPFIEFWREGGSAKEKLRISLESEQNESAARYTSQYRIDLAALAQMLKPTASWRHITSWFVSAPTPSNTDFIQFETQAYWYDGFDTLGNWYCRLRSIDAVS